MKPLKAPSNIMMLRNDMLQVYAQIRNGESTPAEARELVNMSRAIVSSCKIQNEYARLKGEKPSIMFLETNE
jgi:hypothetical protein